MPKLDRACIESRVDEAAKRAPVPDGVLDFLKQSLEGPMGERPLKGPETNRLAVDLIAASLKSGKPEAMS